MRLPSGLAESAVCAVKIRVISTAHIHLLVTQGATSDSVMGLETLGRKLWPVFWLQ